MGLPAPGHAAMDWSATVQPVFAPIQVFGQPGFESAHAHVAFAALPLPAQAPLAMAASAFPVFEMPPVMMALPVPSLAMPGPSGRASGGMPAPPLPLPGIEALPPKVAVTASARAAPAAGQRPAKAAPTAKPATHPARKPAARPEAARPKLAAAAETPAEREARAQMAKRIGDLIVFLVPLTCLAVIWQGFHPQAWPANTADIWWPVRLVVLLVAARYLWRLGLAIALRVLLSQRGQTLHTVREPGDPEVWARLRELLAGGQVGQGAGTGGAASAEFRRRAEAVNAGLRAEARALWASLRESRADLSQRIRVAARDVAHGNAGGAAPDSALHSIFGGGTPGSPR